jgi:hypothetical protein
MSTIRTHFKDARTHEPCGAVEASRAIWNVARRPPSFGAPSGSVALAGIGGGRSRPRSPGSLALHVESEVTRCHGYQGTITRFAAPRDLALRLRWAEV